MRSHLATAIILLLGACGPSAGNNPGDGDGGGGGGGDGGGGGPDSCSNASQCPDDEVCNPADDTCTGGLGCSTASDCGNGGVCEDGGCVHNTTGGVCEMDENCLSGETCNEGHCGCEGVAFQATPVTPNMLIVLDRSDSMDGSGGGGTKWNLARAALTTILDDYGDRVRFGLDMFASDNNCAAGTVNVNIGDGTANAIKSAYNGTDAQSGTPINATMQALANYNGLKDPDHPNYVLLLTDGGEQCCFACDPATPVRNLKNQTPSVKTFVVGFGSGVDDDQLDDLAVAGGTALSGADKFYKANDATQLSAAFDAILGTVLSCEYTLDQVPEDLADLYVYQDEMGIDHDPSHTNGWDYDPDTGTLTFYGAACEALESGDVTDLNIVYGCPGVDVE